MSSTEQASAHYLVKKDGTLVQFTKDSERSWHAGIKNYVQSLYDTGTLSWKKYLRYFGWYTGYPADAKYVKSDLTVATTPAQRALVARSDDSDWPAYSYWETRHGSRTSPINYDVSTDPNGYSIGIELLTVGGTSAKKYEDGLYTGLHALLKDLCQKYEIPVDRSHIVGHEDVNPVERWGWDPNSGFDWTRALDFKTDGFFLPLNLGTGTDPTQETLNAYYKHTEQEFAGGYFPVGANTVWHGGVHLFGKQKDPVYAITPGTVVCCRMPAEDPEKDNLRYGSRNFVLLRHGSDDNPWYSLYYHLEPLPPESAEMKKIAWVQCPQIKIKENSNFREGPSTDDTVIETLTPGAVLNIIGEAQSPWLEVVRPADGRSGFVSFSAQRMEKVAGVDTALVEKITGAANVYQVGVAVPAGAVIGYVGDGITRENNELVHKPIMHWAVFSPRPVAGEWIKTEDADQDYDCDSEAIVNLIEQSGSGGVFNADGELTHDEIVAFFSEPSHAEKLRSYACRFKSEFSVDWESVKLKLKERGLIVDEKIASAYNFWDEAVSADSALPADGIVWHYNPIRFVETYEEDGAAQSAEPSSAASTISDDTLILYSPSKKQFLIVHDINESDSLYKEFMTFHTMAADITAARNEKDPATRLTKTRDVEKRFFREVEGLDLKSQDAVDELMVMKKSPRYDTFKGLVYYRPSKVGNGDGGKWEVRNQDDDEIKAKLKEVLEDQQKKADFSTKVSWSLIEKSKDFAWLEVSGKKLEDNRHFDVSAEARLLRFGAGICADLEFDPFKEKKISLGAEGNLTFALAEGKVGGAYHFPDKNGVNLFHYLQNEKVRLVEKNYQCNIALKFELEASVFVGASIGAAVGLPNIDFSAETRKESGGSVVSAEAGGSAFAGARAEGALSGSALWSRSKALAMEELGKVTASAAGSAGIGAEAKVEISYKGGKFILTLGAGLVVGVGGKTGVSIEGDLEQGVELVAHILVCADYHRIAEISAEAFRMYTGLMFAIYVKPGMRIGRAALDYANKIRNFNTWLPTQRSSGAAEPKKGIAEKVRDPQILKKTPPETLGQVLQTIMLTKEPEDYDEILTILRSAESDHELKWILRWTSGISMPAKGTPGYEQKSGVALKEGIRKVMEFGEGNTSYLTEINILLDSKGIVL